MSEPQQQQQEPVAAAPAAVAAATEEKKKGGRPAPLPAEPAFWAPRVELFNKIHAKYTAVLEERIRENKVIKMTLLPSKKEVTAVAWKDTPLSVFQAAGLENAFSSVASRIASKEEWDMSRPLEPSCDGKTIEPMFFDSEEGRHVFWHSSAHIVGQALERKYGGLLNVGPPTEQDFYYDIRTPDGVIISSNDYTEIEKLCEKYAKEAQPFIRLEVTRDEARELFAYNKYKLAIVEKTSADERLTAYRCGNLVDLCRGPHIPNTAMVKAFSITSSSSVYLDGNATSDQLQRLHGLAFPDKKQLKEWKDLLEEAQRRDHRKIGQDQELFFFHPFSPGSAFFLPRGYRIYQKLMDFMRAEYEKRGYLEVLAPNIYQSKLWEISGHWQHYRDNMFTFTVEEQPWAMKPMNCPGHCLMFAHRVRSYRELPIRLAEFGVLHRNELSGALHGLTRVRRFQQDDSHIFCRVDQIQAEVAGVLDLIKHTYGIFGFDFKLELSTRPEHFLGDIAVWDKAEEGLRTVLDKLGLPWKLNPGDGAFYGPKIDVHIRDALRRSFQCATIQLDFQLPIRFDLQYMSDGNSAASTSAPAGSALPAKWERPVMVHRAVFGSIERFMAILLEHLGGKLPFWISPRQVMIVPINVEKHIEYANKVSAILRENHYFVDVDDSDKTLQKKVREAQLAQYNYILVVGQEEADSNSVNVRLRENNQVLGKMTIQEVLDRFAQLTKDHK